MEIIVLAVIPAVLLTAWAVWYVRAYYKGQREAFEQYGLPLLAVIGGTAEKQTLKGTYAGAAVTAYKRALSQSRRMRADINSSFESNSLPKRAEPIGR